MRTKKVTVPRGRPWSCARFGRFSLLEVRPEMNRTDLTSCTSHGYIYPVPYPPPLHTKFSKSCRIQKESSPNRHMTWIVTRHTHSAHDMNMNTTRTHLGTHAAHDMNRHTTRTQSANSCGTRHEQAHDTNSFGNNTSTSYDSTPTVSHLDGGSCQVVAKPPNLKRSRRFSSRTSSPHLLLALLTMIKKIFSSTIELDINKSSK
jgi:hypothetical protein